jgi:hypothetical protein
MAAISIFTTLAWAGPEVLPADSINVGAGGNSIGESLDLSLSRRFFDHFYINLGAEGANFYQNQEAGADFLSFTNPTSNNYLVSSPSFFMADLYFSWRWKEDRLVWFLNSVGIGVSYYELTLHADYEDRSVWPAKYYFYGNNCWSGMALYTDVHLLDVHWPKDPLTYTLGAKCHTVWFPESISIPVQNGFGLTQTALEVSPNGRPVIVNYWELYLRVGYAF